MKFGFLEKMGGTKAVFDALNEAGYKLSSVQIIYLWGDRKKIPPAAQLKLLEIAGKRGIALSYADFEYKKEEEKKK